jgi:hypothetical protein
VQGTASSIRQESDFRLVSLLAMRAVHKKDRLSLTAKQIKRSLPALMCVTHPQLNAPGVFETP